VTLCTRDAIWPKADSHISYFLTFSNRKRLFIARVRYARGDSAQTVISWQPAAQRSLETNRPLTDSSLFALVRFVRLVASFLSSRDLIAQLSFVTLCFSDFVFRWLLKKNANSRSSPSLPRECVRELTAKNALRRGRCVYDASSRNTSRRSLSSRSLRLAYDYHVLVLSTMTEENENESALSRIRRNSHAGSFVIARQCYPSYARASIERFDSERSKRRVRVPFLKGAFEMHVAQKRRALVTLVFVGTRIWKTTNGSSPNRSHDRSPASLIVLPFVPLNRTSSY